jgi:hypothetical protein
MACCSKAAGGRRDEHPDMMILHSVFLLELLCIMIQPDLMGGTSNCVSEFVFVTDLIVQG